MTNGTSPTSPSSSTSSTSPSRPARPQPPFNPIVLTVGFLALFLCFGAICAFIAYDNRQESPNDTDIERVQHAKELKFLMTASFFGGGVLGAVFAAGAIWCIRKANASET